MQTVAQRSGFVTTVNHLSLIELLLSPDQEVLGTELLRGLRGRIVDLPNDPITFGMNINAKFDALGFGSALCCSFFVGIGVGFCFHTNLGVARFRSPANTHAIYFHSPLPGFRSGL